MAMFEAGKTYHIRMWEPGENGGKVTEYNHVVLEVELPLIKVSTGAVLGDVVVNTSSVAFISAHEHDPRLDEA
jgi:hypothetical protein